ncbi:Gfo/Idh/MocA family protein [Lutispora thermophila]|uniref:Predicted dehydrogenase n=1 Tax=Lutispora thermophila DSM 19022 TaxID=1122184 RepID=A0A1M6HDV6_9FIRM|nr:Gfo/Idh/MocA family oxidoreductase [Lutispora thermophila]SHJ20375.1 Predicted dehydrogenase [Lutispora thermophila DSM 19022]
MEKIVIGMVGCGYAAFLHGNGFEKVCGLPIRLKTICGTTLSKAEAVRDRYGFEKACTDFDELINDPEINVIDILTPTNLHIPMAIKALKAGKHVICEKPLTGYFGEPGQENVGKTVPKSVMYEKVLQEMEELKKVIEESKKKFFYAENFVFATPVQRAAEILTNKKSKITFMRGDEFIIGSSSPLAGKWNKFGGGTMMRNATHIITAMLWLKKKEAEARGENITIKSIVADCGFITECLTEEEHKYVKSHPEDVEDLASVMITFSDGTKCLATSSDSILGGSKNEIEIFTNDSSMRCHLTQNDLLDAYMADEKGLENVYYAELLPSKLGWNKVFVSDEIIRGYTGELQSFAESIAHDKEPESGFDLAYETMKVLYSAYVSAEEGRRVTF